MKFVVPGEGPEAMTDTGQGAHEDNRWHFRHEGQQ